MSRAADELIPCPVAFHTNLAGSWEGRYQRPAFQARIRILKECLSGVDLKDQHWLDAGCGTGTLARYLAGCGAQVVGLDASAEMIGQAQQLALRTGSCSNLEFRTSSISCLPLSDATVDGILCSSVLEYVLNIPACLVEFARVLHPGGHLLVSIPNKQSVIRQAQVHTHRLGRILGRQYFPFIEHSRHHYADAAFRCLLEQSGFAVKQVIPFGSPIPVWLQRRRFAGSLLMFSAVKREFS